VTITRRNYGKGHSYYVDGTKFDGVTTLIKDGVPKPALVYWSAKSVAEYVADNLDQVAGMAGMGRGSIVAALKEVPWTARDTAAAKGTEVHTLAEQVIRGEQVEVPEHLAGFVESAVRFLDEWKVEEFAVEATVAHRRWRYAGTADLFAAGTRPGTTTPIRAVWDWKTAASGIWPETALQLAAYRHAEVYVDQDGAEQSLPDLNLTAGYGVWLRADGYDVIPADTSEQVFKAFQHIAYVARQLKDAKSWLGPAIQPALEGAVA
jgi:hypothetical protein